MKKTIIAGAAGAILALGAGSSLAAAPADWSKVAAKDITLFYPGVSPLEWIQKGTEHGGARALKKGETCAGCHDEEAADMGKKMVSGQKIEPTPIAGKAASTTDADGNTVEMDVERSKFSDNAIMYQFTLDRVGGEFKHMLELLRDLK